MESQMKTVIPDSSSSSVSTGIDRMLTRSQLPTCTLSLKTECAGLSLQLSPDDILDSEIKFTKKGKNDVAEGSGKVKLDAKVLKVRPVRRMSQRKVVPEEQKDAAYYAHRRKNTEAARKCRETKRALDQRRVEIIRAQGETIENYKRENAQLQQRLEFCTGLLLQKQEHSNF